MRGDPLASLPPLGGGFQKEFPHSAGAEALHEVVERSVLVSTSASAVRFATCEILFHVRGVHYVARNTEARQNYCLAPA